MDPEGPKVPEGDNMAHSGLAKEKIHQAPQKDRTVLPQQEDSPVEGSPWAALQPTAQAAPLCARALARPRCES